MDPKPAGQSDLEARTQYARDDALLAQIGHELREMRETRNRGRKATYYAVQRIRADRAIAADAPWYTRLYYRITGRL